MRDFGRHARARADPFAPPSVNGWLRATDERIWSRYPLPRVTVKAKAIRCQWGQVNNGLLTDGDAPIRYIRYAEGHPLTERPDLPTIS
jgi:hypothetical protein